jgi:hypothetical protein
VVKAKCGGKGRKGKRAKRSSSRGR